MLLVGVAVLTFASLVYFAEKVSLSFFSLESFTHGGIFPYLVYFTEKVSLMFF